jgi:hypothetical protein
MDTSTLLQVIIIIVMGGGLIIAIRQLALLTQQIKSQYEWSTRQCALSYSLTKSERLREARINLDNVFGLLVGKKEALTLNDIDKAIEKDTSLYTDIIYLLAHWENMALAIHTKVADETVAFEMVAGMVVSYVRVFRNFIDRRKELNPRAYYYLLDLSKQWEDKLRQVTKPQFSDLRNV